MPQFTVRNDFTFISFRASSDLLPFWLQLTFVNSLDTDQDRRNVGHDLDPKHLTLTDSVPKRIFDKVNFEKKSADDIKGMKNYPACKELKRLFFSAADNQF